MLKKTRIIALISIYAASNAFNFNSTGFKFGYVDVNKIFSTSKPALTLKEELKVKYSPIQAKLQAMNASVMKEQAELQKYTKKYTSLDQLSATDKPIFQKLSTTYQKDQYDLQQKYAIYQQSAQKSQEYASALVLNKANEILKNISEKGSFDLVLSSNQLVYSKPKYDITDQLIEQLNKVDTKELLLKLQKLEEQVASTDKNKSEKENVASAPISK